MTYSTLKRKITIKKKQGRPVRVSMPYPAYKKLLTVFISQQIYDEKETQESLVRAKNDVKIGRTKRYQSATSLVRSLDE